MQKTLFLIFLIGLFSLNLWSEENKEQLKIVENILAAESDYSGKYTYAYFADAKGKAYVAKLIDSTSDEWEKKIEVQYAPIAFIFIPLDNQGQIPDRALLVLVGIGKNAETAGVFWCDFTKGTVSSVATLPNVYKVNGPDAVAVSVGKLIIAPGFGIGYIADYSSFMK